MLRGLGPAGGLSPLATTGDEVVDCCSEGAGDEPNPKQHNSVTGLLELAGRTGNEERQEQPKTNRP